MAEPDTKRGRLEELLNSEQVRQLFIYGGKEVILNLDVMEVVFLYQALPHIRNRLKKEHVWNLLYNEKLVPQLLELGIEPKRLGDDDRQNCLAWAFALKMYRLEVPSETGPPSKWYVMGEMRSKDVTERVTLLFQKQQTEFSLGFVVTSFQTDMRAKVVRVLFDETMSNPSFSSRVFNGRISTEWVVTYKNSAVQQLAQIIYIFLSNGFQMVVNWHNGNYVDPSREFLVREKLEQ